MVSLKYLMCREFLPLNLCIQVMHTCRSVHFRACEVRGCKFILYLLIEMLSSLCFVLSLGHLSPMLKTVYRIILHKREFYN
jgi:hypothetical protein